MIVIGGLAAHIDHGVDRRRAADHLAARIIEAAAVEARLRLGLEAPVRARIADREQIADRNVKPDPIVAAAGFEDEHALVGVGGQPVGQQAAGRARADNDVIVFAFDRSRLPATVALPSVCANSACDHSSGIEAREGARQLSVAAWRRHRLSAASRRPIVRERQTARRARAGTAWNDGSPRRSLSRSSDGIRRSGAHCSRASYPLENRRAQENLYLAAFAAAVALCRRAARRRRRRTNPSPFSPPPR